MNQIERDVYVLDDSRIKQTIDYVRATNLFPIIFHFRDYNIPNGASANAFIAKPSGKAVYGEAVITGGNDVKIITSTQMFVELGKSELQIKIESEEKNLVTFAWPVMVHKNMTEGDIPKSENETGFFEELKEAADQATQAASKATKAANEANSALEAINEAVQGTLINDTAASENTVYSSEKTEDKFARIEATLGYESKNLIPYPYDESDKTIYGITWTDNGDGSVTANGTATGNAYLNCQARRDSKTPFSLKKGKYILSGCPSGGGEGKYKISCGYTNPDDGSTYVSVGAEYGNGLPFELNRDVHAMQVQLVVADEYSAKNLTFRPMIRIADVDDSTWEPYVKPQKDSNDDFREKNALTESTLGYRCKNLLPYPYDVSTITTNGITFTDNGDGTVKVNGTATANAFFNCQTRIDTESPFILKKGKYILSGCASGGASGKYVVSIAKTGSGGSAETFGYDTGDGLEFYLKEDSETTQVQIIVWSGTTISDLTFNPMIRKAEIVDSSWEPYHKSQDTINEEIKKEISTIRSHVGMIIHSTTLDTEDKVKAIYGGTTWEKIEGRFLLGASSSHEVNTTGGEETHTLSVNEMPSHTHTGKSGFILYTDNSKAVQETASSSGVKNISGYTDLSNTGGGQAHNNMPPYKTVYIWERTK